MQTRSQPRRKPKPPKRYARQRYATLFNKGLERVVEAGKTSLDLVVEQNTEVLASYKKAMKASAMPGLFLVRSGWSGF